MLLYVIIDGVCRRFTGILKKLVELGHEIILFTLEEDPEDIPTLFDVVHLKYMIMPAYPDKRVAKPCWENLIKIHQTLRDHKPSVVHVTADGISQIFALLGLYMHIPVVASFHTDILDLLSTHHANFFQKWCVSTKERLDSYVLDSCATTSESFLVYIHDYYTIYVSFCQRKLLKQGVTCEHVIITGVNIDVFNPSKFSK